MGLINLRHSDNRQRRQRFVRPLLELLEDRLQPGSLLVGQPWDIFASNQMKSDPASADVQGRALHFRLTSGDEHNGPSDAAAAILSAGGQKTDRDAVAQPATPFAAAALRVPNEWLGLSTARRGLAAPASGSSINRPELGRPLTQVQATAALFNIQPQLSALPTHVRHHPGGRANQNWTTYVTGTLATATAQAVTLDNAGNAYVTGSVGGGASKTAFVVAYDPTGVQLFAPTKFQAKDVAANTNYSRSEGHAIALDGNGHAYVTGQAFNPKTRLQDAFVMRFDTSGNVDTSYGVGFDSGLAGNVNGTGIVVTADGTATIIGTAHFRADDLFMAQVAPDNTIPYLVNGVFPYAFAIDPASFNNAQGQQLFKATTGNAIALSADGNSVYISATGTRMNNDQNTMALSVNLANPLLLNPADFLHPQLNGTVAYIDSPGWTGSGIAVGGPSGTVFQTGTATVNGIAYALVLNWNVDLQSTAYQTYDENTGAGGGTGIAVDDAGNAYLTGTALDPMNQNQRALVDLISPAMEVTDTLLIAANGNGQEAGYGIAYQRGTVYVAGDTSSTNLSTDGTTLNAADKDAFLANAGGFMF